MRRDLDWATDSDVVSPIRAFILILLANKADESFSFVPLACTLVSEPCTGKSTVLRALNDLETNRCLSRQPRGSPPTSGSPQWIDDTYSSAELGGPSPWRQAPHG